ncbi:MAG: UbiA family prenyltransferase, partial [Actinomycetota bacterium]|nr:UbiA family prenyltransferase [Actinomycetota bacterium]
MASPPSRRPVVALALACHPVPTVAVTALATVLVVSAGNDVTTVLVATAAVLTGQLSIGWSNDLIDVRRDAASGRQDKPLAAGTVSRQAVTAASASGLVATFALSMALGWRAGLAQLCVVAGGWVYNYPLKSTAVSPVPFFVAFGSLPSVATLALADPVWPPVWVLVAAGLIGVSAHFGNV